MKRIKEIVLGILVLAIACFLIVTFFKHSSASSNRELARRIAELSPRGGTPETIDGLRQAIALYEAQIERNVREGAQTGVYWKILAIRLSDRNMHNDALAALERAIYFNSQEPVLFYLTGVSAGFVAKSVVGFSANADKEREHFFTLSENGYLRALELDNTYTKPMYGLGVLYTFELNRPEDAIKHLETLLRLYPPDISAMFVLAKAYVMTERFNQAIELYERIISRTRHQKIKAEAMNNIETVRGMQYE
jgi:tetratricopeptide (TPR) repeat protein